ncbi:hypothetical protein EPH_0006500 [Eimeria praecox]|uniref:Uncharacterized protein n=1 Tax=Eimeria praecox TaxID=51316 RepID=U6G6J4_9EIME|nr:hypothetical protein EPH_0006500 [Eimeria praecox]
MLLELNRGVAGVAGKAAGLVHSIWGMRWEPMNLGRIEFQEVLATGVGWVGMDKLAKACELTAAKGDVPSLGGALVPSLIRLRPSGVFGEPLKHAHCLCRSSMELVPQVASGDAQGIRQIGWVAIDWWRNAFQEVRHDALPLPSPPHAVVGECSDSHSQIPIRVKHFEFDVSMGER